MSEYIPMDTVHPKCPKCSETGFEVIANSRVYRADKKIAMIVCSNKNCQIVVGIVPYHDAFDEE